MKLVPKLSLSHHWYTEELDNSRFKHSYTGKIKSRNGVDIIVDKEWKNDIVDVKMIWDWIVAYKFAVE